MLGGGGGAIRASHVPSKINHIADALSRNQVSKFFTLAPNACHLPTEVPMEISESFDALAKSYQLLSITDITRPVYNTGSRTFFQFCLQYNLIHKNLLLYFAADCANHMRLAASTINLYLYGIRDWCIGQGLPNPLLDQLGGPLIRLDRILKGLKSYKNVKERPRLPITIDILRS